MNNFLIGLAIFIQSLDTYSTCQALSNNRFELNPILGSSCKDIIIRKSAIIIPGYLFLNKKWFSIGLIAGGTIGFTINIIR